MRVTARVVLHTPCTPSMLSRGCHGVPRVGLRAVSMMRTTAMEAPSPPIV